MAEWRKLEDQAELMNEIKKARGMNPPPLATP